MKNRCLFFIICTTASVAAYGQFCEKFIAGIGTGLTLLNRHAYGSEFGIFFTLEPAYRISDEVIIGLRIDGVTTKSYLDDLDFTDVGSITINSQYYLNANEIKLFVGGGLGWFRALDFYRRTDDFLFGAYPMAGVELRHFSLSLDYNFIPVSKTTLGDVSNSYLGVRIVYFAAVCNKNPLKLPKVKAKKLHVSGRRKIFH